MNIGEVIRKYRKDKGLTQEQMADYLGVTAPAVNKWENGNSLPDITLLAPIARLLDITLDTLLLFHENLTKDEITKYIKEMEDILEKQSYDEAINYAKSRILNYPNCHLLIWQLAVILDGYRLMHNVCKNDYYDKLIYNWFVQALNSDDETVRRGVVESLFNYHIRNEEYDKAEYYVSYLSDQNPLKKVKKALIYSKTSRLTEAYRLYEETLFSEYQIMNMVLSSMYSLAQQEGSIRKAKTLVMKQCDLARTFDMGVYQFTAPMLDFAVSQQDVELTITTVETMLSDFDSIYDFAKSSLFEHMDFKQVNPEFIRKQYSSLKELFKDEETFNYMLENTKWKQLINDIDKRTV